MERQISVLTAVSPPQRAERGFGGRAGIASALRAVPIKTLKTNLSALAQDIGDMLPAPSSTGALRLKEITVGVEVTAEGGLTLIGSLSAGASAAISLKYEVE